jgi:hypothetical protein
LWKHRVTRNPGNALCFAGRRSICKVVGDRAHGKSENRRKARDGIERAPTSAANRTPAETESRGGGADAEPGREATGEPPRAEPDAFIREGDNGKSKTRR